ncbi:MAG: hypothetical protein ACXVFQ_19375 [Solirubrobacteraceae bacterium]
MRSLSTRAAGLLILILGLWGGLVPFVGPYFHFTLGPTKSWTWTTGRLWLDVVPGLVAVVGGLMLLAKGPQPAGKLGALLALAAGIWFAIGPSMSLLWNSAGAEGAAHGGKFVRVLEMLGYHTLLGTIIAALAGYALPGVVTRRAEAEGEAEAGAADVAARDHDDAQATEYAAGTGGPRSREPVASRPAPAPAPASGATAEAGDRREPRTAVMDRPAPGQPPESAAADAKPPSDGASGGPPTNGGSSAPITVRRRRGGLFSRLRQ